MSGFEEIFYLAVGILTAVTIHECAHAWMAHKLGDDTAMYEGRLSLNPLAHLDPLGTLLFIFTGFGWGKPVPVTGSNFRNPAKATMLVALAGPASNILLAILLSLVLRVMNQYGVEDGNYFLLLVWSIFEINIVLALFNLIPIPPLDGSKIAPLIIPLRFREYYYRFMVDGAKYFFLLLLIDVMIVSRIRGYSFISQYLGSAVQYIETVLLLGS